MNRPTNYPLDPQVVPRFADVTTFYRLPRVDDWETLDVALTGLPFDSGASYRPGARFGPRAVREASSLLRPYNPVLDVDPYKELNFGDAGDLALSPMDLQRTFSIVEERFRRVYRTEVTPLSFGGDHSLTLPILRGVNERCPRVCFLQMDAHRLPGGMAHDGPDSPESQLVGGAIQENPKKVARANPITYVTAEAPPFLVVHGDRDPIVPHHQSEILVDALREAGVPVIFYTVVGGGHGQFDDPKAPELTKEFLARHLRPAR